MKRVPGLEAQAKSDSHSTKQTRAMAIRRRTLSAAALAVLLAACVAAPTHDVKYKVEGTVVPAGQNAELLVKVQNLATGKYVGDAQVWHVDVVPIGYKVWGPRPSEARHVMAPDGSDGYAIFFPEQPYRSRRYEHFIVRIPGEDELVHATIAIPPTQ